MRLFPILTAIVVAVVLYAVVFERDQLRTLVTGTDATASDELAPTGKPAPSAAEDTNKPISVVAIESQATQVNNTVILRGRTEADRQVDVMAQISGLVVSTPKQKGSIVAKDEVICEIDPGTRFADLAEARAQLAEAEISNTAAARLVQGGYTSETQAVAARATLEAAQAAVTRAETEIARLKIAAPFEGLLETDSAELGSLLQPGAACATVIRLDPIRLVGFLPETQVNAVKIGADAGARLADGSRVSGKVSFVSRSADSETRTFRVDIEVPNPDLTIRDGQTVEIAIEAEGTSAHAIPQSALTLDDEGVMGVRIVEADNTARFVPVRILRDTAEAMLITGLPETTRIITIGQDYVTDGVTVDPHAPGDPS